LIQIRDIYIRVHVLFWCLRPPRSALVISAVSALLLFAFAAPSASATILGGHSPVTILLTDPDGNTFGCTGSGCYNLCTNFNPCLYTNSHDDFVNNLANSGKNPVNNEYECTPFCVYYVDFLTAPDPTTWIDIPNPIAGTWQITYYSTLTGSSSTGEFTITASTCGENGKCSVMCDILNIFSPARFLCDYKDQPSGTLTVTTGTVTGSETGPLSGGIFGIISGGTPEPFYNLVATPSTPSIGTMVTANASVTGNALVNQVVFTWTSPSDGVVATDTVTGPASCGPHSASNCFEFLDTYTPNAVGTWTVEAQFYTKSGVVETLTYTVVVPFLVTNELPLGSLAAAMIPVMTLVGYGVYRKSQSPGPIA
jgi:hypothetical protein